jgi:predicted DNA binding CopG/RHH family protein
MESAMKGEKIPETDSIEELTKFWDSHDLTDFENQLEEVTEPVFQGEPGVRLSIRLNSTELESLRRLASERGLEEVVLIREWALERLHQS